MSPGGLGVLMGEGTADTAGQLIGNSNELEAAFIGRVGLVKSPVVNTPTTCWPVAKMRASP